MCRSAVCSQSAGLGDDAAAVQAIDQVGGGALGPQGECEAPLGAWPLVVGVMVPGSVALKGFCAPRGLLANVLWESQTRRPVLQRTSVTQKCRRMHAEARWDCTAAQDTYKEG